MAEEKKEEIKTEVQPEEEQKEVVKKEGEKEEKKEEKVEEEKGEEKEEKKEEKIEEKEEEKIEIPEKFKKLVNEIENMKVVDLAELVKILEKKFGVSSQPQVVAPAAPGAGAPGGTGSASEEKSAFNIILKGVGSKKIEVIKAVRDVTQKGLKESKDLVDAAEKEPQTVKENVKKEEAEEIKKKFEAAGAEIELK